MAAPETINQLRKQIENAEAIVVGGASGMSAASGFVFYYLEDDVFHALAGSLARKYDRHNLFDLFYDQRLTRGEFWALVLRTTRYVYDCRTGDTYRDLARLLDGREYYVATTNQDAQFFRVFPEERITRIQGDWRLWQCSRPCHDAVYGNDETSRRLVGEIRNDALPDDLIPRCPHCGAELAPWVRSYNFLEGAFYRQEMERYMDFLRRNANRQTLFLELGVGMMTPMFIKEPFMNMVYQWPRAFYATINPQHAIIPAAIASKSLAIEADIAVALKQLLGETAGDSGLPDRTQIFNPSRIY